MVALSKSKKTMNDIGCGGGGAGSTLTIGGGAGFGGGGGGAGFMPSSIHRQRLQEIVAAALDALGLPGLVLLLQPAVVLHLRPGRRGWELFGGGVGEQTHHAFPRRVHIVGAALPVARELGRRRLADRRRQALFGPFVGVDPVVLDVRLPDGQLAILTGAALG